MGNSPAKQASHPRLGLFLVTIALSLLGLLFVLNASIAEAYATFGDQYHFFRQHLGWFALGLVTMIGTSLVPLKVWGKLAPLTYVVGLVLLMLVFVPGVGRELNGAHRWIFLGPVRFQPIEFVKFATIIFLASWLQKHQRVLPFLATAGLPVLLVLLQPDLGSLLVLAAVAFLLFYIAGGQWRYIISIIGAGIVFLVIAVTTSSYRWQRVQTFLNPELDPLGAGFHVRQITLALGRGGWFGQGLGNSRQKFLYIPEASTDSIFAIIAEEVGFVGSAAILALFGLFFWFGLKVISRAPTGSFAQLVGWGILLWIIIQTLLNLAAIVALVPLTGIPLPFFSYGGSALVMLLGAIGVLIRVGSEIQYKR